MPPDQSQFNIRCEWGPAGLASLAPHSDCIIIIDVLSFSTCVDIVTSRGGSIIPCPWKDHRATALAKTHHAILAAPRTTPHAFTLSPTSLTHFPAEKSLVLPSPNGSTLCTQTANTPTLIACLRNSAAVAKFAATLGPRISVIPAGERWPDNSLRPAIEDLLAAGAILQHLPGKKSPEAQLALQSYQSARPTLHNLITQSVSARELITAGFANDVQLALQEDASKAIPRLQSHRIVNIAT